MCGARTHPNIPSSLIPKCGRKALILTDTNSLASGGHVSRSENDLDRSAVQYPMVGDVQGNLTTENFENIVNRLSDENWDVVVGIGGGRVIDTAKMASIVLSPLVTS